MPLRHLSKNHSLQKRPTQLYFALAAVFLALSLLLITPRFCFAAQASDWMSDIDNTVPISHLTVPGTHDAAAYNPSGKVDASFAKCQDKNIQAQLEAGVRSFDLRYVYNSSNGEFELWHGYNIDYIGGFKCMDDTGTTQLTLKSVLTTIQNYLAAHPTEFVFVDLQKEGGDTMDSELNSLKKSFSVIENLGYSASTPINNVRGKILDGSTFLQNASGIYNTWECTVEEKINDLQEVFTNAPAITLGYAGTIEQKCVYTNISWQMSNFSKTPADYADGVRNGFLNSNPFSTYGQKAYGVVLYDFPSESTLLYTIQANNWAKAQRMVQFNTMGGSLINPVTITSGSTISQPTNPTREGYTFNGWYKDENLSQIWNFETDTVDNNTTLYAKWSVNTYNITYNLDGGTNAAANPETYTYGTGIKAFENPTREGYTFEGWFSDSSFTTPISSIPSNQMGEVQLWAKWTPSEYSIAYDFGSLAIVTENSNPTTYTYGIGVASLISPVIGAGYTFAGWYADPEYKNAITGVSQTQTGNVTIYAKVDVNTYNIAYNLDGGTNAAANPATYTYGTGVSSFESPTREGYTFEGWFSNGAFTTQVTNIPATQTGDVALYAKWAKNADPEPEPQPDPEPEPDPDPEPDPSPEPEPDPQPEPEQQVKATTLKGTEAPETAEQIAYEAFPNGCSTVIVCTTASFKDAMSATGLAGALDGPLLLTDTQELSSAVANAIDKLNATQAYIIGGKAVISDGAEQSLKAKLGEGKVMRIAGNEAEDTSVECGKKIKEIDTNAGEYAIVAMQDNFQDALSISSFAYKYHAPIFLTTSSASNVNKRKLTSTQLELLTSGIYANAKIFVPGGPGALATNNIENALGAGKSVQRIYGEGGFDTSNQIATWFTSNGYLTGSCVVIANGAKGPGGKDALAGAALAGKNSGVILLSNANSTLEATNTTTLEGTDSKNSPAYLTNNAKTITKAYVLGGTSVSPQALITKVDNILSEATSS